jgi:D-alanyl-D-alanine carboxypeptidase
VNARTIPADYGAVRRLPLQAEATELVSIGVASDGRDISLAPRTAPAWSRMKDAAASDGITLVAVSGYRSILRQREIIDRKLSEGQALDSILRVVAAPGYSEHHTGRAVDLAIPENPTLTEEFALTPAFGWLEARAREFGFSLSYPRGNPHGIAYEPWHWCHFEE